MKRIVKIRDSNELFQYYNDMFRALIRPETKVLYVGYESNDVLLHIIEKYASSVVAIDREERENPLVKNVEYITLDFLDIDIEKYNDFDYVVLSFILHENAPKIHKQIIEISKKISKNTIIIEPLSRTDKEGIVFEEYIKEYFLKNNKIKQYHDAGYWKKVSKFDYCNDQYYILKRNQTHDKYKTYNISSKLIMVSVQDIVVLLLRSK